MLKELYLFFAKEKIYFWIFLGVLAFYGFLAIPERHEKIPPQASQELQAFEKAEKKWNQEMKDENAFQNFAKKEPVLAFLFEILSFAFLIIFFSGLFVDGVLLFKRTFRNSLETELSPPGSKPWPITLLFKVLILFVAVGLLLAMVFGILQAMAHSKSSENFFMIFHTVIVDLLCLFFVVTFLKEIGSSWRELGFYIPSKGILKEVQVGLLGYVGVLPLFVIVLTLLIFIAQLFGYEPPPHPLVNVFLEEEKRSIFLVFFSVFLATIIGPIMEEIFFRGFCYPIFKVRWGKIWAMVVSAAFFAGIHHTGFVFWPIFVLGLGLAYLYEKRRSLVASITMHITHNVLFISYFFLSKQMIAAQILFR